MPNPKGRPKKKKSFLETLRGKPLPKKVGAPIKYLHAEDQIKEWDQFRKHLAEKNGVDLNKITDKFLVEHIVKSITGLSRDQKEEKTKVIRSAVKQMRDKTGIRILHRNPKQKTL